MEWYWVAGFIFAGYYVFSGVMDWFRSFVENMDQAAPWFEKTEEERRVGFPRHDRSQEGEMETVHPRSSEKDVRRVGMHLNNVRDTDRGDGAGDEDLEEEGAYGNKVETYTLNIMCDNCEMVSSVALRKGKSFEEWNDESWDPCGYCGVEGGYTSLGAPDGARRKLMEG